MGSPGSSSGFGRLRRSLDRLGVKLFLAIAGANLVLVMAVYLIYSWSFDKGLVDYVNQTEQARLTPMITRLAEGYRKNGSWMWLTEDREGWAALLGESLGWRLPRRGWLRVEGAEGGAGAGGGSGSRGFSGEGLRPPALPNRDAERRYLPSRLSREESARDGTIPPITIDWRVMLFDATGNVLIPYPGAQPADIALAVKLPVRIESRNQAVDLDRRLRALWSRHPRFILVPHNHSFFRKLTFGLAAIESIVAQLQGREAEAL